jgi:D-glycero-alpha-D-manno-heptose-7-phosphate kinase
MKWMTARAPARIDFTGAYTDILPFCERIVGHQVNLAVELWATAQGALRDDGRFIIDLPDLGTHAVANSPQELTGTTPSTLIETIVAALAPNGGAGLSLRVTTHAPAGSGLGGSGAVGVAVVAVLQALRREPINRVDIANQAAALERQAGSLGGRQDQFAAALGGLHHLQFLANAATADRLPIGSNITQALDERFMLVHPGGTRDSSDLVGHVIGRHVAGDQATTRALQALNDMGPYVRAAIDSDDPDAFIETVGHVARLQRAVSPVISSPALVDLETALEGAVDFVKPTGSGGPGNCLLICHRPDYRPFVTEHITQRGFTELAIDIDHAGLALSEGESNGGLRV